jgi:hypothetical protein
MGEGGASRRRARGAGEAAEREEKQGEEFLEETSQEEKRKPEVMTLFVIPECASWRRPGIHNPQSWLWIPGSLAERQNSSSILRVARAPE